MTKASRLFLSLALWIASGAAQQSKEADLFKNFGYPLPLGDGWPHRLEWQNVKEPNKVKLVNGRWGASDEPNQPFSGLTLESVAFAKLTGDKSNNAIVVLRYDTGGTQYSHYVYIYSLRNTTPKLLAYFQSGDRAAAGLYRVYAENGKLVVELYDPEERQGDCCSSRIVRKRFQWTESGFKQVGKEEFGTPQARSRLPVDAFGRQP